MDTMTSLLQWTITLVGFLTTALVAMRSLSKHESPVIEMLQPVQTAALKVAGVALVVYVMLITYRLSNGVLTIQTIGMYIACAGLLISLVKDMSAKGTILSDVHAVVAHKAEKLQSSIAQQAAEARKAKNRNVEPH